MPVFRRQHQEHGLLTTLINPHVAWTIFHRNLTLGTQRMVKQECTWFTPYPPVHVTRGKNDSLTFKKLISSPYSKFRESPNLSFPDSFLTSSTPRVQWDLCFPHDVFLTSSTSGLNFDLSFSNLFLTSNTPGVKFGLCFPHVFLTSSAPGVKFDWSFPDFFPASGTLGVGYSSISWTLQ